MNRVELSDIRLHVMHGHSAEIARLMLGPKQVAIVKAVTRGEVHTTAQLSKTLGCSIPNASGKLVKLWRLGYLSRTAHAAPSGGPEYHYAAVPYE